MVLPLLGLVATGLFSVVACVAGLHLLVMAWRSRRAPELWMGLSLTLMLVGNALVVAALEGLPPGPAARSLALWGEAGLALGFVCDVLFNRRVFRPDTWWATGIVLIVSVGLVGAVVVEGLWLRAEPPSAALVAARVGLRELSYGWATAEALRYFGLMRRRTRYGLADPVVTNRFFLWGISSSLGMVVIACFGVATLLGFRGEVADLLMFVGSLLGLPAASLVWLTFFAPASYRRFLRRHSATDRGAASP